MSKIYCISGLGVDERAFSQLHFKDVEMVHIPWLDFKPNEGLKDYAYRLYQQMEVEDNYHLMGLSLGGMIAQEIAKIHPPKHMFLLSTATKPEDISSIRLLGKIRIQYLLPDYLLTHTNPFLNWYFGVKSKTTKVILKEMMVDADPTFIRRAITAIVEWQGGNLSKGNPCKPHVIHGAADRLIPMRKDADVVFPNGGHLVILEQGEAISQYIEQQIKP